MSSLVAVAISSARRGCRVLPIDDNEEEESGGKLALCANAQSRQVRRMFRLGTMAGWTSTLSPWSRSPRNRSNIRSSLRSEQKECRAGVPLILGLKRSG